MADENDDLLNFDDGDFDDVNLNEDELLLSDEDDSKFDDENENTEKDSRFPDPLVDSNVDDGNEHLEEEVRQNDGTTNNKSTDNNSEAKTDLQEVEETSRETTNDNKVEKNEIPVKFVKHKPQQQHAEPPFLNQSQPFRQKFHRWPNRPNHPRWNSMPHPNPSMGPSRFPPMNGPVPPRGHPNNMMRPMRPNQFFNSYPQPPQRPMPPQRFFSFKPNEASPPHLNAGPRFPPAVPINANVQAMPRKVLINPNFKGGVEAVKNQLMKDQMFTAAPLSEDELLRKQQEFINQNVRQIERRRHEPSRSPSPRRRRRSYSTSPPRYRKKPFRNFDRRRGDSGSDARNKDENLPEEDEETRAYRVKIELQRKKREEILKQKEMRRKQQQAEKAKETQPAEPLQPIVVTDKKIVLNKRKSMERSMTPPIKEVATTALPMRRIVVLKSVKDVKSDQEPQETSSSKAKIK